MKFLRRWLVIPALVAASAWVYLFAAATSQLGTLFDSVADTTVVTHVAAPQRPPRTAGADAAPSTARRSAPEFDAQPASTDDLSSEQMLRLLTDELETETDPAAADAFLREFRKTLDAP